MVVENVGHSFWVKSTFWISARRAARRLYADAQQVQRTVPVKRIRPRSQDQVRHTGTYRGPSERSKLAGDAIVEGRNELQALLRD